MKVLAIILILNLSLVYSQVNNDSIPKVDLHLQQARQDAWTKLSVGLYMHLASGVFLLDGIKSPETRSPLILMNFSALFMDALGVGELIKYRKKKHKHGKDGYKP